MFSILSQLVTSVDLNRRGLHPHPHPRGHLVASGDMFGCHDQGCPHHQEVPSTRQMSTVLTFRNPEQ